MKKTSYDRKIAGTLTEKLLIFLFWVLVIIGIVAAIYSVESGKEFVGPITGFIIGIIFFLAILFTVLRKK